MLDDNYDILLIDDDTDVLEAYCMLLEQAGYRVYACHDPLAAKSWFTATGAVLCSVMSVCRGAQVSI